MKSKILKGLSLTLLILLTLRPISYSQNIEQITKALYVCDSVNVLQNKIIQNNEKEIKLIKKINRKKTTKRVIISFLLGVITVIWINNA